MALIADDAEDRAQQLIALSEQLAEMILEETRLIEARQPLPDGGRDAERNRLVNAYRLEMARIKQDHSLIDGAQAHTIDRLKAATAELQQRLDRYARALEAVRVVSEGLLKAMAEAVAAQSAGPRTYAATGGLEAASAPPAVALNQRA